MLKRIVILSVILSTLALLALVPVNVAADSEAMPKAQTTVEVTVSVETAVPAGETPASSIPVTGGLPMSTIIIFGLLGLLGVAIIIGGAALLNRRQ